MKKLLLVLALILMAFSGCVEEKPRAEELKTMMIEASNEVDTMRFSLDMDQVITIDGLNESQEIQKTTIKSNNVGEGLVNVTDKSIWVHMTTSMINPEYPEDNFTMEVENYLIEDTMYMKLDQNWTKIAGIPEDMWDEQNQLKNQMAMFEHTDVELVGSEKINNQDTYKLEMVIDMDAFSAMMAEQLGSMPLFGLNLTEIYKDSEMDYVVWISKETHLPLKADMKMEISMTPEAMGLPAELAGFNKMNTGMNMTTLYFDYNLPVKIELPEEALDASSMPSVFEMMDPASSTATTV